ncbi:hypothetical protein H1P_5550002 [Hyella patelloides LEGE 07179]|uniref:Uncharacterized protein n=1 Tax=Hyella patelloides LEGE 07179 TaxID=945734 RepID=A0A563W0R9_9CYAN|nr:hypothetical protein H1P_5550002 [Hyella patelloides LEGE 07179]
MRLLTNGLKNFQLIQRNTLAIAWAEKKLPDVPKKQLKAEFDSLNDSNGKKALAWISHVHQLSDGDF